MNELSLWKRLRYWLEELGCRFLAWGIPLLSRRTCLQLASVLGSFAFAADRRGRSVALSNLECVFGDRYSPQERSRIARASYQNFLRTMLDLFWAQRLTEATWRQWMHLEGFEELRARVARENRGVLVMGLHHGQWEWVSLAMGHVGIHTVIVAENFKNPRLTQIFCNLRQVSGQTIIPQENSVLRLLKVAKRGGATGMLIDLNIRPTQAATAVEAFGPAGLKMCVPLLHAVLAQRAATLLVPIETHPLPDGSCRIIAHPAVDLPTGASLGEIAQRCWDAMEPIIRERPHAYLWAYKHFRYRPRNATRPYPAYANASSAFEKLLAAS